MTAKHAYKVFIPGVSPAAVTRARPVYRATAVEAELSIIDLLEHPDVAEREKILVTPTFVQIIPAPAIRFLGDFSKYPKGADARRAQT